MDIFFPWVMIILNYGERVYNNICLAQVEEILNMHVHNRFVLR